MTTTNVKTYKGVNLINGRTKSDIDFIIENYNKVHVNVFAERMGYNTYKKVTPIIRTLKNNGLIAVKEPKTYKGVPLKNGLCKEAINIIITSHMTHTPTELAQILELKNIQQVNWVIRFLKKGGYINNTNKVIKEDKKVILSNTFDNYDGEGKAIAREKITNSITQTQTKGSNILTLPADRWLMEQKIIEQKQGYKFTAVERNKDTYKEMVTNAVQNTELFDSVISMQNCTIGEVIKNSKENTFSSAIMDYCGVIDTVLDELKELLERNIVKQRGFITVTVAMVNRTINNKIHSTNHSNKYIEICGIEDKDISITTNNFLIHNLLFNLDGRYKLEETFTYKDKTKSYGMMLYIIRRMK